MNFRPRLATEPEINLVSLIDVVLMIVVFFILSSTLVAERSLKINLPVASTAETVGVERSPLVLAVRADGRYELEGRLLEPGAAALRAAILAVAADDLTRKVVLRADAEARHREVILAIDSLRLAGFTSLDIATTEGQVR